MLMDSKVNHGSQGDKTMANEVKMTAKEKAMLDAIINSDYQMGGDPVGQEIWLWDCTEQFGPSAGGIMASLVTKGWAGTTGFEGTRTVNANEQTELGTAWITEAGVKAVS